MVLSASVACMPAIWAFCSAWARAATAVLLAGDGLVARDSGFGLGLARCLFLVDGSVARDLGLVSLGNGLAPLPG